MPTTPHIAYRAGILHMEATPLPRLAADPAVSTPAHCVSAAAITDRYHTLAEATAATNTAIHYAVKANPSLAVLSLLARLGAGADTVSAGEIRRALAAGIPASRILFSGVGKSAEELAFALEADIVRINIESTSELRLLSAIAARRNTTADIAIRINPDIDPRTHRKITTGTRADKFGIPWRDCEATLAEAAALPGLRITGLAMHIGSQITALAPYEAAFRRLAETTAAMRAQGYPIAHLDIGGGLPTRYDAAAPAPAFSLADYAAAIRAHLAPLACPLAIEPGRALIADAGLLLTRLLHEKHAADKRFLIIDAGMNDLLRPALYDAHHDIVPVSRPDAAAPASPADIVGPICESSDRFAADRPMPPLTSGDLLAILQTGAYGACLASTYNSRLPAAEVMVSGTRAHITRPRPTHDELLAAESIPPWLTEPTDP